MLWHAIAAAPGVPVVIGLSGRDDAADALLAQADELLLAVTDPVVAGLGLASLSALGPPAALLAPPAGFAARRLAALGLAPVQRVPEGVRA